MHLILLLTSLTFAGEICKHAGQAVEETKDLTGKLICRDDKERLTREVTYDQGKQIGPVKIYFENGKIKEAFFTNEEGKRTAFVSFDENGRPTSLKCAKESVVPQDREYCGYQGKVSEVSLYQGDKVSEKVIHFKGEPKLRTKFFDDGTISSEEKFNGKKSTVKAYFKGGKVKSQHSADNEILDGKEIEFFENGKKSRESVWAKGKELRRTTFFMNGKTQKRMSFENKNGKFTAQVDEYFDQGNIKSNGRFQLKDTVSWWATSGTNGFKFVPQGLHKVFSEHGKLKLETNYDDKGNRLTEKEYDQLGKLIRDEKFKPDGTKI